MQLVDGKFHGYPTFRESIEQITQAIPEESANRKVRAVIILVIDEHSNCGYYPSEQTVSEEAIYLCKFLEHKEFKDQFFPDDDEPPKKLA